MVGRAALNIVGQNVTYFFNDDKYCKVSWTPDQGGDTVTFGPTETFKEWKTLKEAGFARIDAILPIPGNVNKAYFFCGSQYARIQFTPSSPEEKTIGGIHSITGSWGSLAKAGFERVDAAMIVPGTTDQAYFFSGNEFCRVRFKEAVSSTDELLDGPHMIRDRWSGSGFQTIDTIVPSPTSAKHIYVFSGTKASRLILVPGGGVETDVGPSNAADYWPSLHKAGFY
ncbi:hypothetical protein FRC10_005614 [Ceratobasidium sp. 414]|nr:hypothetical protein FRC10_005614 [Ceratobasidium sp. 414]